MSIVRVAFLDSFPQSSALADALSISFNAHGLVSAAQGQAPADNTNIIFTHKEKYSSDDLKNLAALSRTFTSTVIMAGLKNADAMQEMWLLQCGADDVFITPSSECAPKIIAERAKNAFMRYRKHGARTFGEIASPKSQPELPQIKIDLDSQSMCYKNKKIHDLSPSQLTILKLLTGNPLVFFTRDAILQSLHPDAACLERTVDSQIKRLRRTLRRHNVPELLETKYALGYRYNPLAVSTP